MTFVGCINCGYESLGHRLGPRLWVAEWLLSVGLRGVCWVVDPWQVSGEMLSRENHNNTKYSAFDINTTRLRRSPQLLRREEIVGSSPTQELKACFDPTWVFFFNEYMIMNGIIFILIFDKRTAELIPKYDSSALTLPLRSFHSGSTKVTMYDRNK